MKRILTSLGTAVVLALPSAAVGQVLKFEGIVPAGTQHTTIGDYYNGGAGPNYGIEFSTNALAICLNTPSDQVCSPSNGSRGGLGDPNSQTGGLFFLDGPATFMNSSTGFTTGFSLFYSAIYNPGSLAVWSGENGTGTQLAFLSLPLTTSGPCPGYGAGFCPFFPVGVPFLGTAHSIEFAGVADEIGFDDVTFGSVTPGTSSVPEPASLALLGTGLVGVYGVARRRRILA